MAAEAYILVISQKCRHDLSYIVVGPPINDKLAPYGTGGRILLIPLPTSKSRDTKTRTKTKNPAPISFRYCPPNLGIPGHLPALIINGGE